jgi:hypothetical protein
MLSQIHDNIMKTGYGYHDKHALIMLSQIHDNIMKTGYGYHDAMVNV